MVDGNIVAGLFCTSIVILIVVVFAGRILLKNNKLEKKNFSLSEENTLLGKENKKIISQKKSSEVRLGKIGENMAPFFMDWPYDPNDFRFLGNPVDGIQFTDDEIIFMEIKTGKARLTDSQKKAKQLVKEGKVKFATFRVNENGCLLKIEE